MGINEEDASQGIGQQWVSIRSQVSEDHSYRSWKLFEAVGELWRGQQGKRRAEGGQK